MKTVSASFFQFAGVHSFLIGMLPFFIPVLLLQRGESMQGIALFIGITGLGFLFSLKIWEKLYKQQNWRLIIGTSFIAELLLVIALVFSDNYWLLILSALLNGAYNCFYWATQRVLFSTMTAPASALTLATTTQTPEKTPDLTATQTGRQFGNFQILVVVLLKLGIIIGAFLLEKEALGLLLMASTLITFSAIMWFCRPVKTRSFAVSNSIMLTGANSSPASNTPLFRFKDKKNSVVVFYLDGVFLFLESYFWVISLFLIARQSIKELGIIIVLLTVFLSLIFYLLKNRIDSLDSNTVYISAVILYAASWVLRSVLNPELPDALIYPAILLIAFLTTFFRLSFNKRFFDHAKEHNPLQYLLIKSYLSQIGIVIFYSGVALLASYFSDMQASLSTLYLLLTPVALIYLAYTNPTEPAPVTALVSNNATASRLKTSIT
ncbi:hypothetical protein [Neptunomonas sp.]|uniref:hypothetical protein n=1 Tax=Neptunomonas sp. TaxID=1971898 RepID=UPI0035688BB7